MEVIILLKILFLLMAVWGTIVNTLLAIYQNDVPFGNVFVHVIGITGFVVLQFNLYE